MLVLNRKVGEQIVVPQVGLVFTVLEVQGDKVSVGITAPKELKVHRREVWERIQRNMPRPQETVLETPVVEAPVEAFAGVGVH
jgi:carbon storage regulator